MARTPFIGTGPNPEGPDLPLGFGMRMAQEPSALDTFGTLDGEQKTRVVDYIQSCSTGDEAKERIESAVCALRDCNVSFFG